MAATSLSNVVGSMKPCQLCRNIRPTRSVTFRRNIGMVVVHQTRTLRADMCKTCMTKNYWDFMGKNLLFGPWGVISFIVTPIYLITNTYSYLSARQHLQNAVE